MIGKELLEKKPVSLAHIKNFLETRDNGGKEATFEQTQTLDYATKFSKLSADKAESLHNNLLNLEGMTDEIAVKAVDFLPEDAEAFKLLLPKPGALTDAQIEDALKLVKKHAGGS